MPRWWEKDGQRAEPGSYLVRNMAYEVAVVVFTAAAVAVLAFLVFRGQFEDLYIEARGKAVVSEQVSVLTIGSEALYLWDPSSPDPEATPRALLAELVGFLDAAGAQVIVLDVLLDQDTAGDAVLAEAARAHGQVIAAERFAMSEPVGGVEFQPALRPVYDGAITGGFANLQIEEPWLFSDAVLVRHAPLIRQVSRARLTGTFPLNVAGGLQAEGQWVPSMTLLAAHAQQGGDPQALLRAMQQCGEQCAPELAIPPLPRPLDEGMVINFRGPERHDGIPTIRAASVLRALSQSALAATLGVEMETVVPAALEEAIRGRVVVIGRVDEGEAATADRFVTPYSFPTLLHPDMAGVRVQAQIIDTLISGRHVRNVGGGLSWGLAVLLLAGVVVSAFRVRDDLHFVLWLGVAGILLALGVLVFRWTDGVALELGPPLGAMLVGVALVHVVTWTVDESGVDAGEE